MNEKEIAEKIYAELQEEIERFQAIKKWDAESVIVLGGLVADTIKNVEKWAKMVEPLTGKQKKAIAVRVINKFVDIPFVPDFLESHIISIIVDWLVNALNKFLGHDWLEKSKEESH